MTNNSLLISIIIPCRNEEKFIGRCLNSVITQDYPKEKLEVLVIDGMSEDKTKEIIKEYSQKYPFIKLLENPQKFTPFGLNIGIKEAKGKIIIRMDSHASYQLDYVSKCLRYLREYKADNVGGVIKTLPKENTAVAKAIAIALSHPFGAGGSYFRTLGGNKVLPSKTRHGSYFRLGAEKPRWVDTVFGGCYKREVFEKIGLFSEKLIRSQDIEFNRRLKRAGGKILLVPEIVAFYYPQANLKNFLKHNLSDGTWTTYPLKFGIKIFSLRHLIPLIFVLSLMISAILIFFFPVFWKLFLFILSFYFLVSLYFSIKIAEKEKNFGYLFLMPIIFASRHFGYGFGSFLGFIKP